MAGGGGLCSLGSKAGGTGFESVLACLSPRIGRIRVQVWH